MWNLPASLIDRKQGSAFVLRVVSNNHAHEQGQTNHAAQKYVHVDVDSVHLELFPYSLYYARRVFIGYTVTVAPSSLWIRCLRIWIFLEPRDFAFTDL